LSKSKKYEFTFGADSEKFLSIPSVNQRSWKKLYYIRIPEFNVAQGLAITSHRCF